VNQTEASSDVQSCDIDVQYPPKCSLALSFVQMLHIHSPYHRCHVILVTLCVFEETRLKRRYVNLMLRHPHCVCNNEVRDKVGSNTISLLAGR